MAVNQSYAIGWLVGRLDWECTLAEIHARAGAPPTFRAPRRSPSAPRPPSPVRGMSRARAAPARSGYDRATASVVVVG